MMDRRRFLAGFVVVPSLSEALIASDDLQILPPDRIHALTSDFDSNRDKVRLVLLLSPT